MYYRNINTAHDLGVILEICIVVWTCGRKVGISKGTSISFNNVLSLVMSSACPFVATDVECTPGKSGKSLTT